MGIGRVRASIRGTIRAPASVVWNILTDDWGGFPIRARFPNVEKVVVTGGDRNVPLTRTISFGGGVIVAEELISQDSATRRLYCRTINNGGALSNYLATLYVDELPPDHCCISISGDCDVPDPTHVEDIKSFIEENRETGIIAGIGRCLSDEASAAAVHHREPR